MPTERPGQHQVRGVIVHVLHPPRSEVHAHFCAATDPLAQQAQIPGQGHLNADMLKDSFPGIVLAVADFRVGTVVVVAVAQQHALPPAPLHTGVVARAIVNFLERFQRANGIAARIPGLDGRDFG